MNDDDYRRLLGAVDDVDDDVPPNFTDELWDDLRSTILRGGPVSRPRRRESFELVDEGVDRQNGSLRFAGPWLGKAAAAALVVAGVMGLVMMSRDSAPRPSDQPTPTVTDTTVPTVPPILDDPAEACHRFEAAGPLAELTRGLGDPESATDTVDADLQAAIVAFEVYVRDLEAAAELTPSVITPSDVAPLRRALQSLEQARFEFETGDLERAKRSVDAAVTQLLEAPSPWC